MLLNTLVLTIAKLWQRYWKTSCFPLCINIHSDWVIASSTFKKQS